MSKFCVDFYKNFEPLTFLQLDIFSKSIISEFESIQQEFLRKAEFVNDCYSHISTNENKLIQIDICMKLLESYVENIEKELQIIECDFIKCNRAVANMEKSPRCDICSGRGISQKTDREMCMDLLLKTSLQILQMYDLSLGMEEVLKYFDVKKETFYDTPVLAVTWHLEFPMVHTLPQ
ncbi:uncharacterized protein [Musca autumnalis]|uniref:uncharacterized protein n=1 Tax=Musca autumnalis TaxID=221902 RepID=UPI003CEC7966